MLFGKKLFDKRKEIDPQNLPEHIAIIMDGNGRWAKKRGLPRKAGHKQGAKTFEEIVDAAGNLGIRVLTFYAFSTENWSRPKDEVDAIMALFLDYLDNGMKKLAGKNTRIRFIGDFTVFDDVFRAKMKKVEADTAKNSQLVVNVAINYGGRQEICQAAQKAASMVKNHKLTPEGIDDKLLSSLMYEADYPDPDLIIRPSGEKRLSNFLLWQSAYSEFWFSNILWPDFKKKHLVEAILDYQKRNRRYGGV